MVPARAGMIPSRSYVFGSNSDGPRAGRDDPKEHEYYADGFLVHNCGECGTIDGEAVNMEATFSIGVSLPPAHPNCRCAVTYEEVAEPTIPALAATAIRRHRLGKCRRR